MWLLLSVECFPETSQIFEVRSFSNKEIKLKQKQKTSLYKVFFDFPYSFIEQKMRIVKTKNSGLFQW